MNKQPLVSMITYCFNGERFVSKYFEAILSQTYQNIELIFFNNGSSDKTGEIAEQYKDKLLKRGILVQLIHYKENQNTCLLKQEGMHLMHGDYFFGCDSDDIIHPTYIEEMCGYLEKNPDKGIVFCHLRIMLEETQEQIGIIRNTPNYTDKGAFVDLLSDRNCFYTAISYMIRTKYFLQTNFDFNIEISPYGENPQLQLPLLYHNYQGYIEKPLGDYTIRSDSYSGKFKTDFNKQVKSSLNTEEKLISTIKKIKVDNLVYYEGIIKKTWRRNAYYSSLNTHNRELIKECYNRLKEVNGCRINEFVSFRLNFLYVLGKKIRRVK